MSRLLRSPIRIAPAALAVAALAAGVGRAAAQEGCQFGEGTRDLQTQTLSDGSQILRVGAPHLVCSDGVEIWADSAVAYTGSNFSHFMGRVRFSDPVKFLTADTARYFTRQGRLQAHGHVVVIDSVTGAEIRGQDLVYLLKNDIRDEETMDVSGGRPEAILYMKVTEEAEAPDTSATVADTVDATPPADTLAMLAPRPSMMDTTAAEASGDTAVAPGDTAQAPGDTAQAPGDTTVAPVDTTMTPRDTVQVPYHVVADRIFLQGDRYFRGMGEVEIERDSLLAFGDTAEYDQVAGRILLRRNARVEGEAYQVLAPRIDVLIPRGDIEEMRARDQATLLGEDLRLDAPLILLFMVDGEMERLVALPTPEPDSATAEADSVEWVRPVAVAEQFRLVADSIEAVAPGGVLDHLFAVGSARGESSARDSLNTGGLPEAARTDWLEGDTVVARFTQIPAADSAAAGQGANEYRLEELVARVGARSLYRMLPSDSTARPGVDPPAVHYVMGDAITITMKEGQVDRMEVEGQTRGVYLEPLPVADTADSLAAPPDTTARTDTVAAGRRRARAQGSSRPDHAASPGRRRSWVERARRPEEAWEVRP